MNDIYQIGKRLKGLREVLEIPVEEIAQVAETTVEHYLKMESGEADPSVYRLTRISKRYGISLDVLLFGEEPRMRGYYVTRKEQGFVVERDSDYSYQSLASGFRGAQVQPFMTVVQPLPEGRNHAKNSHDGQEFDYVLEGRLEITIESHIIVLQAGASEIIYSTLMMKNGFIAGNINFENPDDVTSCLNIIPETVERKFSTFLSNSFGFGGTNSTLIVMDY